MKIVKHIVIFCTLCCAAATPASASQKDMTRGISRELSKGFDKVVELMNTDDDHAPLIKEMAMLAFEKKLAKEITRKQKSIKNCLEEIEYLRENIKNIRNGDYDHWDEDEPGTIAQKRQKMENDLLVSIDKYLAKITATEKEIVQYTDFQNKIQSLKNAN